MLFSPNFLTPGIGKIPQAHSIIIQQAGFIQAIYLQRPIQHRVEKPSLFTEVKINSREVLLISSE